MHMFRSIMFCSLAMLAAAIIYVVPTSATDLHRHDPGIYSMSIVSFDFDAPMAFIVNAEHVAVLHHAEAVNPSKFRSISILKPEYIASLATDGQNFIDTRMRC